MGKKTTIPIGVIGKIEAWRDGQWVILYVADGSGSETTVSLLTPQALDLATVLKGMAIAAAKISA